LPIKPAINHFNDVINRLFDLLQGAILFAASANVITEVHPVLSLTLGILVAGGCMPQALAIRPAVTATTAGAGNVPVSVAEDFISMLLSIFAIVIPA
jgi:hypothetical protein